MQNSQPSHVLENAVGLRWLPHSLLYKSSAARQCMHPLHSTLGLLSIFFVVNKYDN